MSTTTNIDVTRAQQIDKVVESTEKLIESEVNVSCQEYELLTKLNLAATSKYESVAQHTNELLQQAHQIGSQQAMLDEQFKQLNELFDAATRLESTVTMLERYMDEVDEHIAK